eukprot:15301340-Alexandrium_andersonii.AAC.1
MPMQGQDGHRALRPAARVEGSREGRVVRRGRGCGCRAVPRGHRHLSGRRRAVAQRHLVSGC